MSRDIIYSDDKTCAFILKELVLNQGMNLWEASKVLYNFKDKADGNKSIEENVMYVAALMTASIIEEIKYRLDISYGDTLKLIESNRGDECIENKSLMFTLKDNSLDECIDLILGKIDVEDLS